MCANGLRCVFLSCVVADGPRNPALNQEIAKALQQYLMASMRFVSEEANFANALPPNLDDSTTT